MRIGLLAPMLLIVSTVGIARAAAQQVHQIELPDRTVRLSVDDWRALPSPEPFAVVFEATRIRAGEALPQRITLFKLPMQVNDRLAVALTADELCDFLFLYPVKITYRMQLERETYWVESVQTFDVPVGMPLRVPWRLNERPSEQGIFILLDTYDAEVKRTRFQLRQLF